MLAALSRARVWKVISSVLEKNAWVGIYYGANVIFRSAISETSPHAKRLFEACFGNENARFWGATLSVPCVDQAVQLL